MLIFILRSNQSIGKNQLFSTRPRLARSGSKTKFDRSQLPPTDPSSSSRQAHDPHPPGDSTNRTSHVEVIGKGYSDEKNFTKLMSTEMIDEKSSMLMKSRAKIIKGQLIDHLLRCSVIKSFLVELIFSREKMRGQVLRFRAFQSPCTSWT